MVSSVAELCEAKGIRIADTCYRDSLREMMEFKIVSGDFYEFVGKADSLYHLFYKNSVEVMDFPMLTRMLPQLGGVEYPIREHLPYFTAGLSETAERLSQGEKVAVEGGPCLFGTDEVRVEIVRKSGRRKFFDYNTGKSYLEHDGAGEAMDFREFVLSHAEEIEAIHFENRKPELTPQEWAFLKYPFEIAGALSAPLVIPIPDLSYVKYLDAVLKNTGEQVRQAALEEFRAVSHAICDLYLGVIDRMKKQYPNVPCEVVHERNRELCERYYQARAPYMERNKTVRRLTGIPEKLESIRDYVSMPALPYYLYGISNVIEVDSMDETDSFRKCRKAHKGALNLSCILFPELLSEDGVHTIFEAPRQRKEYGQYAVD